MRIKFKQNSVQKGLPSHESKPQLLKRKWKRDMTENVWAPCAKHPIHCTVHASRRELLGPQFKAVASS